MQAQWDPMNDDVRRMSGWEPECDPRDETMSTLSALVDRGHARLTAILARPMLELFVQA